MVATSVSNRFPAPLLTWSRLYGLRLRLATRGSAPQGLVRWHTPKRGDLFGAD